MGAIKIRHGADVRRAAKSVLGLGAAWLAAIAAIALLAAARADAMPGASAAIGLHREAGLTLARGGPCPDGRPCAEGRYEEAPYEVPRHYPQGWKGDPPPYPPEAENSDDCVEDPYAARAYPIRTPPAPYPGDPMLEEPCGVRCWWRRLRAGYCGRGCDYYRYRMTAFPEGHLGRHPRRVACRTDH
ncbi:MULTISPECIES: hypothetical protein [Rhodomicrobium]|uniref:hypothetical protein n=1 Tax=Rhodomicrobium TaxID=1068 RepID=UPI000B4AB7F5|nr:MULTISPECIES: hypothetical protein [Rhodomicrobium]